MINFIINEGFDNVRNNYFKNNEMPSKEQKLSAFTIMMIIMAVSFVLGLLGFALGSNAFGIVSSILGVLALGAGLLIKFGKE